MILKKFQAWLIPLQMVINSNPLITQPETHYLDFLIFRRWAHGCHFKHDGDRWFTTTWKFGWPIARRDNAWNANAKRLFKSRRLDCWSVRLCSKYLQVDKIRSFHGRRIEYAWVDGVWVGSLLINVVQSIFNLLAWCLKKLIKLNKRGLVYLENFYFRSVKLSQFVPIGSEQSDVNWDCLGFWI